MTNFGEISSSKTGSSTQQPLIPPASIRAEKSSSKSVSPKAHQKQISHQDQNMRPSGKSTNHQIQSQNQNQNQIQNQNQNISSASENEEVWNSMENLFWDHMNEVENKWNTLKLNDDIWAKLIYFERNRRLAKAYVSAPVLTVDGSTHGLDGFRIGLSGIDNTHRNLNSIACLRSIGHGIKLKIDNHGNILIRKAGKANQNSTGHCSVWVKDWPLPMTAPSSTTTKVKHSSLIDTCVMREIEHSDASYKLFDMRKFRLQLEKRRLNNEQVMDWRQCVSIVSFVQSKDTAINKHKLLDDPCWLMLINIIAIDMIKSSMMRDERGSMNLDLELQDGSATLTQNHSLLGLANYARNMNGPFRASSSSSILFPTNVSTTASSIYNYRGNPLSGTTDSVNNLSIATNERIKKLRTANSKYRLSSMKNGSYHRRYQSIQQLSSAAAMSNNTIYTTFNSKFINNPNNINSNHAYKPAQQTGADSSSTSDYNSFSRSASSGHRLNNLKLLYNDSSAVDSSKLQHHHQQRLPAAISKYHRDEGKMLFSRKALEPLLDTGNKSLSLSTFDLSHRKLDLRSMQSSIKMNYDYLTENVDTLAYEEEEEEDDDEDNVNDDQDAVNEEKSVISSSVVNPHSLLNTGSKRVLSISNHINSYPKSMPNFTSNTKKETSTCCCTLAEKMKQCNQEHFHQHHHRESPFKMRQGEIDDNLVKVDSTRKELQQKVSRASIASSSSSSGCADNDYFMSQSSSSMSSSTASNERELFSQPASSSGIVCSGSTSDEYEDGQNKPVVKSDTEIVATEQSTATKSSKSISASEPVTGMPKENGKSIEGLGTENRVNGKQQQQQVASKKSQTNRLNIRRGYLKTIEPTDYCCPPASVIGLDIAGSDQECQCPTLDYNCHCCCDCFSQPIEPTTCGCEDDLLFERLQHDASNTNLATTTSININSSKANKKGEQEMISRLEKVVLPSSLSKLDEKLSDSAILLQQRDSCSNKSTKDLKQTSGWLERRKYSKILPKFIFSSNGSNRQVAASAATITTTNQLEKFIQRDDRNSKNDKFRFTSRSNQDLS